MFTVFRVGLVAKKDSGLAKAFSKLVNSIYFIFKLINYIGASSGIILN